MTLKTFWKSYHQDDHFWAESHLVIEHPDYAFPGGVIACSIWPFVASEVTGARIQRNHKFPVCSKCRGHLNWLLVHFALSELKEKARIAGVLGK